MAILLMRETSCHGDCNYIETELLQYCGQTLLTVTPDVLGIVAL